MYARMAGGPGDSGVSELGLPGLQQILQQYSGGVYDIVSWDPRGVGLTVSVPPVLRITTADDTHNAVL